MDWNDYALFLAVARAKSIRAAARELGVDHASISRQVRALETRFGTTLFQRSVQGLTPTAAGVELLAASEQIEAITHSVERQLANQDGSDAGDVTVSINPVLAGVLLPALSSFDRAFPKILVRLDASMDLSNLDTNEADVAIRVGAVAGPNLIRHRVCGFAMAVYGPKKGTIPSTWIGWDPEGPYPTAFLDQFPGIQIRGRIADWRLCRDAVAAGLGIAALPCVLGGGLQQLTSPEIVSGVYVLRHYEHRATIRIRMFVDHIVAALEVASPAVEGR